MLDFFSWLHPVWKFHMTLLEPWRTMPINLQYWIHTWHLGLPLSQMTVLCNIRKVIPYLKKNKLEWIPSVVEMYGSWHLWALFLWPSLYLRVYIFSKQKSEICVVSFLSLEYRLWVCQTYELNCDLENYPYHGLPRVCKVICKYHGI